MDDSPCQLRPLDHGRTLGMDYTPDSASLQETQSFMTEQFAILLILNLDLFMIRKTVGPRQFFDDIPF